jgi:DNA polymerase-3 subunit delta'
MESGNQPDVIWVTREKASLGVDEIREQLCNTMDIKPFSSPYKIYLVPEAEKMTEAAQNALLKTIEEPPEYGIVILMTSNISALLPTIQSRCLTMEFRPLSTAVVESYVKEHCQVPDYQARASAAFAQGNLGKAMRYAKSEDFIERKDHIISLLRHVEQMDLSEMLAVIKDLGTRKDEVRDYIDLMVLWYRDVLLFKATKDINQLLFQEASYISREASHRSYEKIEEILQAFEKAKVRLRANVNFDITMELMLLTLK